MEVSLNTKIQFKMYQKIFCDSQNYDYYFMFSILYMHSLRARMSRRRWNLTERRWLGKELSDGLKICWWYELMCDWCERKLCQGLWVKNPRKSNFHHLLIITSNISSHLTSSPHFNWSNLVQIHDPNSTTQSISIHKFVNKHEKNRKNFIYRDK